MSLLFLEILIFLLSILLIAFITAAEIALSSFGENKIDELKEKGDDIWQLFTKVHQNPEPYYGTIYLISITLIICSVVVGFLISAKIIDPTITEPNIGFYNNPFSLIVSFIVTVLLIASILSVFSFLIPKAIGFKYSDSLGRFFIKILVPLSKFFVLPAKFLNAISNFILIPFREKTSFSQSNPSEDEILHIISDGVKSGAIDELPLWGVARVVTTNQHLLCNHTW